MSTTKVEISQAVTTDLTAKKESPFTTGALAMADGFWRQYINSRPSPPDSFIQYIIDYHRQNSDGQTAVAHEVGTGPGNIAARLLPYFDHVVGSDVNGDALAATSILLTKEQQNRTTFVKAPAEQLAHPDSLTGGIGNGNTDVVLVSECMPLLDAPAALESFATLLRPGGTLAIYFYGRPLFVQCPGAANADLCNSIYDRAATLICSFLQPFVGTPGFPVHNRATECLESYLDNIEIPSTSWANVERHKWNCDRPLLFNSKEGFDFKINAVDRRDPGERRIDNIVDDDFWAADWDVDRVAAYLDSVYPGARAKAAARYSEAEKILEELRQAMGGGDAKVKVTFPVVLVLATKKTDAATETPIGQNGHSSARVHMSPEHVGIARIGANPPGSLETVNRLLQKNHDEYHMFWRDVGGHNHIPHSLLSVLAMGGGPQDLRRAYDDGSAIQRERPPLDHDVVAELHDEEKFRSHLRVISKYTSFLAFFEQKIAAHGWQQVLQQYCFSRTPLADTMLAQLFEGAYHPIIHVGFGVEFDQPSIVAEGLAQAATHDSANIDDYFMRCEAASQPGSTSTPLVELYEAVRANDTVRTAARVQDGPVRVRDGVIGRARDEIVTIAARYRVDADEESVRRAVAEMISCAAYSCGGAQRPGKTRKIDFFFMHSVTSSIFFSVFAQQPWLSIADRARLVERKARLDLVWYAASSAPALHLADIVYYQPTLSAGMDWTALYRATVKAHDDGHVAKFIRALKNGENETRPFEGRARSSSGLFPVKRDMWLKLAQMAYDTTLNLSDDEKWIWGAGFDLPWQKVPNLS